MIKIGDRIRVIDENLKGEVVRTSKKQVTIIDEFGFEQEFHISEVILDQSFVVDKIELKEEKTTQLTPTKTRKVDWMEVDLHIGHLVDYPSKYSNYEMLQIQLQTVEDSLQKAREKQYNRVVFIHGHGSGKLKYELDKLLQTYAKIEFYDASFRKYKQGATEVKLL